MKLQGHVSRKVGDKEYVKHVLVIPSDIIKRVGWTTGKEVNIDVKGRRLVLS